MKLSNIKPVTILVRYENEFGDKEDRYAGFLTGCNTAMYVEGDYGNLIFVEVVPTDEPGVFLEVTGWTKLGNVYDADEDAESIIVKLASILHNMTAYDFFAKVMVHVREEFDYEGLIIPKLIENECGRAANEK